MIAKKHRVPRKLIPRILKGAALFKSSLFLIRHQENELNFNRYRVIISKKIDPKAVKRNKLRRQVYEALRLATEKIDSNSTDYILIPKKLITTKSYQEIAADIETIILKKTSHNE